MLIPHGDTVLKAGDVLIVVAESQVYEEIRHMCQVMKEESARES